jgi:hypothetical protein
MMLQSAIPVDLQVGAALQLALQEMCNEEAADQHAPSNHKAACLQTLKA